MERKLVQVACFGVAATLAIAMAYPQGQVPLPPPIQPPAMKATTTRVFRPTPWTSSVGHFVHFRPRDNLWGKGDRTVTFHAKPAAFAKAAGEIDWIKNYSFPMDLNDQLGDCYYAAACHGDNLWTANIGNESFFSLAAIRNRYFFLSGGDNGLNDEDIQNEWKKRYLADIAAAKIANFAYIDPNDAASMQAALQRYGCVLFTFAVSPSWISNSRQGSIWDAASFVSNDNGHAVAFGGFNSLGNYKLLTWGVWLWMTPDAVRISRPGAWVSFSTRWFAASGYAPNGQHIRALAEQWRRDTGQTIDLAIIGQFPPPVDPPPPSPPPPPPSPPPAPARNVVQWTVGGISQTWELVPVGTLDLLRKLADSVEPESR